MDIKRPHSRFGEQRAVVKEDSSDTEYVEKIGFFFEVLLRVYRMNDKKSQEIRVDPGGYV